MVWIRVWIQCGTLRNRSAEHDTSYSTTNCSPNMLSAVTFALPATAKRSLSLEANPHRDVRHPRAVAVQIQPRRNTGHAENEPEPPRGDVDTGAEAERASLIGKALPGAAASSVRRTVPVKDHRSAKLCLRGYIWRDRES